jgi:hypothetical protein
VSGRWKKNRKRERERERQRIGKRTSKTQSQPKRDQFRRGEIVEVFSIELLFLLQSHLAASARGHKLRDNVSLHGRVVHLATQATKRKNEPRPNKTRKRGE